MYYDNIFSTTGRASREDRRQRDSETRMAFLARSIDSLK